MALSAGVAYVDVLPNMGKFAPALAAQTTGAAGALTKFAKFGTLAVAAVGAGSVKMAADFEASMRNVNSIARLPEPAFKQLNDDVLALAGATAQAPKTLAEGLYDLVSSGFDARDSLEILEASAKAATAGMTTTDVAVKGVAAVLNAYNLPASKAAQVSDTLFKTVERGVISFEELSMGIGDTLPFAAALGIGLDEVGAATSTMTLQGLGASETFTRIRNLIQTMIKPGEDLSAAIKDLGYENGEALIKAEGFQGALEALVGTTDGSKDAVAKLFPNIRALGGALALTGKNSKDAQADLKAFGDTSGATNEAFEEQSKSLAVQWQELKARLSVLAIELGNVLIPALNDVVRFLNEDFASAFSDVKGAISDVVGPIADALGPAIEKLGPAFDYLKFAANTAFDIFIFNAKLGAAAIKVVIDVVSTLVGVLGDIAGAAADAFGALKDAAGAIGDLFDGAENDLKRAAGSVRTMNSAISGMGNAVVAATGKATGGFKNFEKQVAGTMEGVGRSVALVLGDTLPQLRRIGERMAKAVADGIKSAGRGAIQAAKTLAGEAAKAAAGEAPKFGKAGKLLGTTLGISLTATGATVQAAGRNIAGKGAQGSNSQRGQYTNSGRGHGQALASGVSGSAGAVAAAARSAAAGGAIAAKSLTGSFQSAGAALGNALAAGLRSAIAGVSAAANALAAAASRAKSGARAGGGPVSAGGAYTVGERGRELFVPERNGYIIPNHALPALATEGAARAGGRTRFVIEDWARGLGYFEQIAERSVDRNRNYDDQRARMRR